MSDDQQPLLTESHVESHEVDEKANEEDVVASPAAHLELSDDENVADVENVENVEKIADASLHSLEEKIHAIEDKFSKKSAEVPAQVEKKMTDARVRMTGKIDGMVHRLVSRVELRVGQAEKEMERKMEQMVDQLVDQLHGELDRQIGAFDTTVDETIQKTEKTLDEMEAHLTKCCVVM